MKILGLQPLYRSIKADNEDYYIFSFVKNKVHFEILFDIYTSPFKLHFLVKRSNFSIIFDVNQGFEVNPFIIKEDYKKLCDILGLEFNTVEKFSPKIFLEEFNNSIPEYQNRHKQKQELLFFYSNSIEEKDKLNFNGFIEWNKSNTNKSVSESKLNKTRILFPEHFEYCKRNNVSIRYTDSIQ